MKERLRERYIQRERQREAENRQKHEPRDIEIGRYLVRERERCRDRE